MNYLDLLLAIKRSPLYILSVESPTDEMWETAISAYPSVMMYNRTLPLRIQKIGVSLSPSAIKWCDNQTDELQELAMQRNPLIFSLILSPSPDTYKAYIRYIKNKKDTIITKYSGEYCSSIV